ncbi:DNA polymerase [Paenibacillus swuensis]|uniref:DNA polymerase n=1 Tax=Paenibacillus swuensis TaxID=1178515 RepID=A0A172TJ02_9BACL|nr:non-homologous end-joining DNA ligase [Paenibacillus swuensis]ANE47021.1 DNA polymerase [Paenibacillus swuensis]
MCAAKGKKGVVIVEGCEITVSNPDKYLWPDQQITKADYLSKLAALSPYLLKYCDNRYLTTIRWPNGIDGKSFYQKNCPEPTPEFVSTASLDGIDYVNLDSLPTLLWLGNLACLEFHPSFNYINDPLPAEWVIDIDPSLEVEPRIMEAAYLVGEVLDSLKIQAVPKTSGATGVQIYVPIERGITFDELRKIGQFIGEFLVKSHPNLFTIERLKKNRGDLIYIDYLQHYSGKTLSAPYTPRARPFAPVSTPLKWEELKMGITAQDFHLFNIQERLHTYGDLIQEVPAQNLYSILQHLK